MINYVHIICTNTCTYYIINVYLNAELWYMHALYTRDIKMLTTIRCIVDDE